MEGIPFDTIHGKKTGRFYILKDDEGHTISRVGILDKGDFYQVQRSDSYPGQMGYGEIIYTELAKILDKPLHSDNNLSSSARGLWDKLVSKGLAKKIDNNNYLMII